METALRNFEYLVLSTAAEAINKPMFLCDPARPKTFEIVFKRFRLASTPKRVALAFFNQRIEFTERFWIAFKQSQIVIPSPR
jgi:hypothetical protein